MQGPCLPTSLLIQGYPKNPPSHLPQLWHSSHPIPDAPPAPPGRPPTRMGQGGNYGAGAAGLHSTGAAAASSQGSLGRNGAGSRVAGRRWRQDEGRNYRPALLLLHGARNTLAEQVWTCLSPPLAQPRPPPIPQGPILPACLMSGVPLSLHGPAAFPSQEVPSYG